MVSQHKVGRIALCSMAACDAILASIMLSVVSNWRPEYAGGLYPKAIAVTFVILGLGVGCLVSAGVCLLRWVLLTRWERSLALLLLALFPLMCAMPRLLCPM